MIDSCYNILVPSSIFKIILFTLTEFIPFVVFECHIVNTGQLKKENKDIPYS